jgi:hypothetical protein
MRGWRKRRRSRHPRARRRRVRRKTEAGSPGPRGSGRHERDVASERCRGQRTSREASGRSWLSREATSLAAWFMREPCTRPDRWRRIGYVVPERAVASRCVEAHADADRSPLQRPANAGRSGIRKTRRRPKPTWPQGSPEVSNDAGLTARARRATGSVTNRTFIGGRP